MTGIHRKIKKVLMLILFTCLFVLPAAASSSEDVLDEQSKALGLDKLAEAAGEYSPGDTVTGVDLDAGLQDLLDTGSDQLAGVLRKAVRSGVLLLTVVLLCSLAQGTCEAIGEPGGLQVVPLVGALAITAISVADVHSLIGMGREALNNMTAFSKILLPTMAVATAASGAPGGAAARQMATMLFSTVLMSPVSYTHLTLPTILLV